MRMRRSHRFLLMAGFSLCLAQVLSCSKKTGPDEGPKASKPSTTRIPQTESKALHSAARSGVASTRSVEELIGAYQSENEYRAKMELAYQISSWKTEEALNALGALFQRETDPDLKEDLLDAISEIKSLNTPTLLVSGLDRAQPKEVRIAAIDELRFYGDPIAIPSLEPLLEDPDAQIRELTRKSIDSLKHPRISEEHRKQIFEGLRRNREAETRTQ